MWLVESILLGTRRSYSGMYPGAPRVCTGVPEYQTWMIRSCSGKCPGTPDRIPWGYPGVKPGCFGHTQVCTRGYPKLCALGYPGIKPVFFGHTWVCTRVPSKYILCGTQVPNLDNSVILGYVPGYLQTAYPTTVNTPL